MRPNIHKAFIVTNLEVNGCNLCPVIFTEAIFAVFYDMLSYITGCSVVSSCIVNQTSEQCPDLIKLNYLYNLKWCFT